jgi:hypothetical protein
MSNFIDTMTTNTLNIQIAEKIEDAPIYGSDSKILKALSAIIVKRGAISGNPTIDIQLVDADGNKYLVMATSGIIESLAKVVEAKRIQSTTK